MPLDETPLANYANNPVWTAHAAEFDRAWTQLEQRQLVKIRAWAPAFLGGADQDNGTLFYMFSGPDFLYANAFFPNANTYILCGTEPIGPVPNIQSIPPEVLPGALANLRKSLDSLLNWSFFITKNMKLDLTQTQLNGTLPLLYIFIARAGYTIDSVATVGLDRNGNFIGERQGQRAGSEDCFFRSGSAAANALLFHDRSRQRRHPIESRLHEILSATGRWGELSQSRVVSHARRELLYRA